MYFISPKVQWELGITRSLGPRFFFCYIIMSHIYIAQALPRSRKKFGKFPRLKVLTIVAFLI